MWMKGSEGLGPPDALKVFRCVVMREALRAQVHQACARAGSLALFLTDARACSLSCSTPFSPSSRALAHSLPATASPLVASVSRSGLVTQAPTSKAEAAAPPSEGNPVFWRPVSPFKWHQLWGGTSVTRGKTQGVQAWSVAELEEVDAWHGRPRGDDPNVYTLRLPGGILLQVPTLVRAGEIETFRVAWLPVDGKLRRLDAKVTRAAVLAKSSARVQVWACG